MIWPAGNPQALQNFQSVNRASSTIAIAFFFALPVTYDRDLVGGGWWTVFRVVRKGRESSPSVWEVSSVIHLRQTEDRAM